MLLVACLRYLSFLRKCTLKKLIISPEELCPLRKIVTEKEEYMCVYIVADVDRRTIYKITIFSKRGRRYVCYYFCYA